MQQSKKFRKVMAVLMVIAMLFSIATPAMAALISGESFTVKVVKVVDGNTADTVTLTKTCLQSTKHSGFNHSTNLYDLANSSGFTGYKGYNWSKYTTVPSSYIPGLAPNNKYAAVHYNITGSAPYKADETLFLFFESTKYSYTVNHVYRTNGTEDGRTTTTVSNVAAGTTVSVSSISKLTTYQGNTYSYTSGSPTSATIDGNSKIFMLYYDRAVATTTSKPYTIYKVFSGVTDVNKIPTNFAMTYNVANNGGSGTLTYDSADKILENSSAALKWTVQVTVPTNTATNTNVTFTESNYKVAGYDWKSFNGSPSNTATRQIAGGSLQASEYLYNSYTETPTEQNLTVEKHVTKVGEKNATEATGNDGNIYYNIGDIIAWTITIHNPNSTAKNVSLGESAAYNDIDGTGNSPIAANKLTVTGGDISWTGNTNANVTVPAKSSVKLTVNYTTTLKDVKDELLDNAAKLFNHVVLSGYTVNGQPSSANTDSETVYLKTEPEKTETDTVPSITKTTSATDVKVGDTFAYTITVKNSDTDLPTTKVTVTDSLPDGLEYVENTVNGATATFVQDGQNLTWTMDKLEADAAATITLTVKATKAGKYTNSATVGTGHGSNTADAPEVSVTEPVTPPVLTTDWSNLSITKTVNNTVVNAGEDVVYKITVANNTGVELTGIEVSEKLDKELTFVSAEPSDQYNATSGVWTIAALGNGKTATLTITAKANEAVADGTTIPNTATITVASDGTNTLPEDKGPSASVDITVNNGGGTDTPTDWSKLTVNKTVAVVTGSSLQFILDNPGESILPDAKVTTGSNLLYTITVSNDTGKALTGITVQEALDSNLTFAESDSTSYDVTEGLWTIEQLADGAKAVLHILVVVKDDAETGAKIANTATITAAQDDGDGLPDRNRPSDTVTVTVDETVPGPVEPINPQPPEPGKDDDNDEEDDNNGNTSSGGSDRYDGPYSDDEETIPDEDVPLTDATEPETNPAEDVPDNTDENHIIEDSDVPLSDLPGESLEITEPQVPLGDAPKTGDAASATAYAGLLAFAAGGLMITRRKYN